MRTCTKCNAEKVLTDFHIRRNGKIQSWCKQCTNNASNEYRRNNEEYNKRKIELQKKRLDQIRLKTWEYLSKSGCIDCNEKDPIVLDFDHRSNKEFNISSGIKRGMSWTTLLVEIKKCDIRCANCHRRKTAKERNYFSRIK